MYNSDLANATHVLIIDQNNFLCNRIQSLALQSHCGGGGGGGGGEVVLLCVSCFSVCVCALVRTNIWGHFCVFNHISADTRGVGMSPVVKPMPINVLSIFKHIDIHVVNAIS